MVAHHLAKLLLLLLSSYTAFAQPQASPDSLFDIRDSVLVTQRDGHFISSTIVTKRGTAKPLPVIIFYTVYDQGPGDAIFGKIAAERDYVGIVAYSRGIRTDPDEFFPYEHDGDDAYDLIDWTSKQSWCDGRVGMFGGSYTGFVQWSTLRKIHPALKTIVPQAAIMPGFDTPMENNIPQGFALGWANDILQNEPLPDDLNQRWYEQGSSYRSMDSLAGRPNKIFQQWLRHPDYDSYWTSLVPTPMEYSSINIPILSTTGYYDGAQIGTMQYAREYYRHNATADLYLVIGPYNHWGAQRSKPADTLMGYPIDPVAKLSMRGLAFDWFDYIFKGAEIPAILKDKINYQVMGSNEWRHAPDLGEINNDTLTLYFSDAKTDDRFSLAPQPSATKTFLNQTVDFTDRESQNNYFTPFIINDSLDAGNGLVFATDPFPGALTINGSFFGMLRASINKRDMDFTVTFYEQMPGGQYFLLTSYMGRASYSKDRSRRELLRANEEEEIFVHETRMVSKRFSKGSRLVCVLNVNKHPFDEINYGTGKNVHDETIADAGEPLQIKWFTDSFLIIPVWRQDD